MDIMCTRQVETRDVSEPLVHLIYISFSLPESCFSETDSLHTANWMWAWMLETQHVFAECNVNAHRPLTDRISISIYMHHDLKPRKCLSLWESNAMSAGYLPPISPVHLQLNWSRTAPEKMKQYFLIMFSHWWENTLPPNSIDLLAIAQRMLGSTVSEKYSESLKHSHISHKPTLHGRNKMQIITVNLNQEDRVQAHVESLLFKGGHAWLWQ